MPLSAPCGAAEALRLPGRPVPSAEPRLVCISPQKLFTDL